MDEEAFVFVYLVIALLGWWRPLFHDPRPVRRWVSRAPTTAQIIPAGQKGYPGAVLGVYLVCGIILLVRRHHIELSVGAPSFRS
jgi:hypothetical protein